MVQLTEELVKLLDDEAARRGISRSALIREAIAEFLENGRESAVSRAIVEGYRRIPQATPDVWGNLQDQADIGTRELVQRLDEEEHTAGDPPW